MTSCPVCEINIYMHDKVVMQDRHIDGMVVTSFVCDDQVCQRTGLGNPFVIVDDPTKREELLALQERMTRLFF